MRLCEVNLLSLCSQVEISSYINLHLHHLHSPLFNFLYSTVHIPLEQAGPPSAAARAHRRGMSKWSAWCLPMFVEKCHRINTFPWFTSWFDDSVEVVWITFTPYSPNSNTSFFWLSGLECAQHACAAPRARRCAVWFQRARGLCHGAAFGELGKRLWLQI